MALEQPSAHPVQDEQRGALTDAVVAGAAGAATSEALKSAAKAAGKVLGSKKDK